MQPVHIVERAYQLARTGHHGARSEIARALEREGYAWTDMQHLQGAAITRDLNRISRDARRTEAGQLEPPSIRDF